MAFDPDAYLAPPQQTFDPDAYLAGHTPAAAAADAAPNNGSGWGSSGSFGGFLGTVGQTADDAVRAAANAATFGMADRLAGWAGGAGTDAEVKRSQEARERSPIASTAGDVAGSAAIPGLGGARLATNLGGRFGARALGYGVEGAGVGALQGAGTTYTGNPDDYIKNALTGGAVGGVLGGAMGGILGPRPMVSSAVRPTIPEQQRATNMAYATLRANPTHYEAPAFNRAAQDLEARLLQRFDPAGDSAPASFRAVNRMQDTQTVTPKSIEDIRAGLNQINPLNKTDRTAAYEVKRALDNFVTNPPPGAVRPAQMQAAQDAAQIAQVARDSNAGLRRTQLIDWARTRVGNQTLARNSGLNAENNLRGWASRMVSPNDAGIIPARVRGYDNAEIAAMNNVLNPGWADEGLRWTGNLIGKGGGLGAIAASTAASSAGYFSGHGDPSSLGVGTLGTGLALATLANRRATGRMNALQNLVSERNPIYRQRAATAPMVPGPSPLGPHVADNVSNARDAMTYQLMRQQAAQEDANVP